VIVNGTVEGDIHSFRHLELAPKGCVHGNVYYTTVEMAAGSEVNGNLTHQTETQPARETSSDPTVEVTEAGETKGRIPSVSAKVD
jgi:cytoskeletal protein CcmA (bactofilin family)